MRKLYTIDFTDEDHDLALNVVRGFFKDLDDQPEQPMTLPTIAYSFNEIEWGEFGFDTGDKVALVLNIEVLSRGRLKTLSPKELQFLLFNNDVNDQVTHAMINAMAWLKDVEQRGLNATNEREVLGFVTVISDAVVESLEKNLVSNRLH